MGLKIHSIAEIPESVSRSYYLYILDYYNWDEPIGNTLRSNFDRIAEFASKNDAVVIQGVGESHFYSQVLSWEGINGLQPEEILPAFMITTLHPQYFLDRNDLRCESENIPEDKLIFVKLSDICKTQSDVISMIEKVFEDIKSKQELKNFKISKELKASKKGSFVDALILEPNISGVGINIKKLFGFLSRSKAK